MRGWVTTSTIEKELDADVNKYSRTFRGFICQNFDHHQIQIQSQFQIRLRVNSKPRRGGRGCI
jgi:hypothetical protein